MNNLKELQQLIRDVKKKKKELEKLNKKIVVKLDKHTVEPGTEDDMYDIISYLKGEAKC